MLNEKTNEITNEKTSELTNEIINELASEEESEKADEIKNEKIIELTNEIINENINEIKNENIIELTNEIINENINENINEIKNEKINEFTNEIINENINEINNENIIELTNEIINEKAYEIKNEKTSELTNEIKNEIINEKINLINEKTNEIANEKTNEKIKNNSITNKIENELNKYESIKITLLGNPGVGKTEIISRYVYDDIFNENNITTIGANYSEKIVRRGNKEYELDIWDTAGQEKFHSLGKHFYKDSYIVCLVYDITNQESLDALKTLWYPDLQKHGEKYHVIAVVGNRCELYENDELADEEQAKQFAKEINAIFMLISSKTGDGINKLFDALLDKFLSNEFNSKYEEMLKKKNEDNIPIKKEKDKGKKKKKKLCIIF